MVWHAIMVMHDNGTIMVSFGIMVWYGMVWYGMVWYGMVWYSKSVKSSNFESALLDSESDPDGQGLLLGVRAWVELQ